VCNALCVVVVVVAFVAFCGWCLVSVICSLPVTVSRLVRSPYYRTAAVAEFGLILIIIVVLMFFSCGLLGFGKKELVGFLLGW